MGPEKVSRSVIMDGFATTSFDRVRGLVEERFPVYDAQYSDSVATFYINVDHGSLETDFDSLKDTLKAQGLVPILRYHGGEHSIHVVHRPERNHRSERVNLVLFIITLFTTTFAGVEWYWMYRNVNLDTTVITEGEFLALKYLDPMTWVFGFLTFALPLMLILGVHEMGHYVYTRRHRMEASLPFFIPVPPLGIPIGTFGAFISMREPIPNRKALLDIGVSGPIAGFIVAIPVLLLGFALMKLDPVYLPDAAEGITIGTPLLYDLLAAPFGLAESQIIHPTAFAGWVGLFVTAINLLPAGQLDGGHMATALLGDKARYLSYVTVAVLTILGFGIPGVITGYSGWLFFALLILFLGAVHPPTLNAITPLDKSRVWVGVATFALVALCFTPVPFAPT